MRGRRPSRRRARTNLLELVRNLRIVTLVLPVTLDPLDRIA
jgi:hypothetical protein